MDVALAGGAVADQHGRHPVLAPQPGGQGQPVGHRDHGTQVADHPDHVVVEVAEVERAVAAARERSLTAQELAEQHVEVEAPAGEDAQVAVGGQDPVVVAQRGHEAHRHGLLADAREPLR